MSPDGTVGGFIPITPSYTGTVRFTSSDSAAVTPANYTFVAADNGTRTLSVTLKTAGSQTVTATDAVIASITGTHTLAVSGAAIDHLVLAPASASIASGGSQAYTARAQDLFNNDLGDVTAAATFALTPDGSCAAPTCAAWVAGPHTVTSTHTASGKSATATLTVTAAGAHHLVVSAPAGANAGSAFTVTATAKDAANNTVTGYSGTVRVTSTDAAAVLPASYTFVAGDLGTHTFSLTLNTAGSQTISAIDTLTATIMGSASVSVTPATISGRHFLVLGPTNVQQDHAFTIRVVAVDAAGKAIVNYTGSVHFTTTLAGATLPTDHTFTASDRGEHAFTVKLHTLGAQTLTVTDRADPSTTGSKTVRVKAEAADDQLNDDDQKRVHDRDSGDVDQTGRDQQRGDTGNH
jgi:hypothetical protein